MDRRMEEKRHRMNEAKAKGCTTRHWQLQMAAIEDAFIEYFNMKDNEAEGMKGRAQVQMRRKQLRPDPKR